MTIELTLLPSPPPGTYQKMGRAGLCLRRDAQPNSGIAVRAIQTHAGNTEETH